MRLTLYFCGSVTLTPARSIVHLSIITATIPRINSFIADVQTRQAGLALTQRDYESYVKSGDHSASKDGSRNWSRGKKTDSRGVLSSFRPDATAEQHNTARGGDEIEMDVRDNIETSSQSSLQRYVVFCAISRLHPCWMKQWWFENLLYCANADLVFLHLGTSCTRRPNSVGRKSTTDNEEYEQPKRHEGQQDLCCRQCTYQYTSCMIIKLRISVRCR